ncbi:MAG TPA: 3-methyl-2-oxobutanoate hydroxymethyltransferase [Bacteroidetes bacterium]|uniref:3-methyl-2-oxobutanoate hydroxymethyltransferase n=1 Tax=candidate division TA06 bacterium TaxID=2250710 RepID=A0A660S7G3_UNCT6|nr:MAG: 3-methyl-2-oxobutanoate hydroxymethyltransferase [candidate division TA06 bacterium]HHD82614.1 3-methyl-2-oxobutanoate hydroxymethyltransferase [Bacteroidota bacterium]
MHKLTIKDIYDKVHEGKKIALMTAYDYPIAKLEDTVGIDIILVGDSIATTVFGRDDTLNVTMDDMIHHAEAVSRACDRAIVIGDMPFMTYQTSIRDAIFNAGRFVSEAKCDAVKLEGGRNYVAQIEGIVNAGIPVMGHIGLLPQSYHRYGGYRVQGKNAEAALGIIKDAIAIEKAGVFAIIAESVPENVTSLIKNYVSVPVFGIGAGSNCDGQIIVVNDILGLNFGKTPKFVKVFKDLKPIISEAISKYVYEVNSVKYPTHEYEYHMSDVERKRLEELLKKINL